MTDGAADNENQLGFELGDEPAGTAYRPDLAEIREDLEEILASARSVTAEAPWDERTFRYNRVVFTQMCRWLPDDEAARLGFEFSRQMERIEPLLAA
ncbi:MAG TPA: hypothetical protein VF535_15305 [Allosphingosinicella sp.]|jgi:hypothetical protein